jgi:enoyl-CoA hydratase
LTLLCERSGRVSVLTLAREDVLNALDAQLVGELADALDELDRNDALGAAVIAGAGGAFSVGLDFNSFLADEPVWEGLRPGRGLQRVFVEGAVKPLVAAVEGYAVGGGLELALTCDVIIGARGSSYGIPEVRRGLIASGGALGRLPPRVGPGMAAWMGLTGECIGGDRALQVGLLDELTEEGEALAAALDLASKMAVAASRAVVATKQVLRRQADWTTEQFWRRQATIAGPVTASEDAAEGARAFLQKRAPSWSGR